MTPEEYSGDLRYANGIISYRAGHSSWSLSVSKVRLIAEYTNSDGPYLDDYFFVFMTAIEDGWHEASFYAKGRDEFLAGLSAELGVSLECGLCNSTNYKTRILWPESLKGQPLMDVVPPSKQNWWRKLTDSGTRELKLSTAAREVFG
jgi:hypothetical protein